MNLKGIMLSERNPISKSNILHDTIYIPFLKTQNYGEQPVSGFQGLQTGGGGASMEEPHVGASPQPCDSVRRPQRQSHNATPVPKNPTEPHTPTETHA